ncbi:TonB-dependent receptor [Hyphomicrobium sp. D-2]|uniref:TonB-dependent receptor n=1 Tax=Hyphomicrobium sp. D-2 TaxID=3041621 RepID=UPI0024538BEA|nr:TonB-dependent receptor [Hyphomicrobium sp. D-2]MDH4982420.1 TonB-dependent receptor [Hyphomicrobium sp. D-2]
MLALGRQANLKLVYASALTAGKQTGGVSGQLSSQSAIDQLLAGTGLSYSFSGANTVRIFDPAAGGGDEAAAVDGAIALDTIDVSGSNSGGAAPGEAFTVDTPFATAGSVSHISREQIERVRPQTAGDIFRSTPGVISAGSRGTSIQPNIRGLQGADRVKTTIDGAEQSVSSDRGYIGSRDESYIDPDLIAGVDITKGPTNGTIGGLVAMRTISAPDIITGDKNWGVQVKGGIGNNTIKPLPYGIDHRNIEARDRPSFFEGNAWNGSLAGAVDYEHFEGIVAYAKRNRGNYFAGTRTNGKIGGIDRWGAPTEKFSAPGEEVPNSSEETESLLAKGKLKWADNQSLELAYRTYDSISGEIIEQGSLLGGIEWPLVDIAAKSYTARYRWNPDNNDLINVRANVWHTDLAVAMLGRGDVWNDVRTSTMVGGDIGNVFKFETSVGLLSLDTGAEYTFQNYWGDPTAFWGGGSTGKRTTLAEFANATFEPADWLSITGGIRYDWFENEIPPWVRGLPERLWKRDGDGVSLNGGVTLTPLDGLQVFGLFKQGLKAPAAREFGLDPERANSHELGFNILRDSVLVANDVLRFKTAAFHNTYDDYIVRYRASPNLPYFSLNIDSAIYKGFEFSGSYDSGRFFFEGAFTNYIDIQYCLTSSTCSSFTFSTDSGGGYVPPKFHGSLTAGVRLFEQKLTLGARTHFASERIGGVMTQAGGLSPPPTWPEYGIYDLFGSYKLNEKTELSFSVENVTDEYYFDALTAIGLASPGRTGTLSFTARF